MKIKVLMIVTALFSQSALAEKKAVMPPILPPSIGEETTFNVETNVIPNMASGTSALARDMISFDSVSCSRDTVEVIGQQNYDDQTQRSVGMIAVKYVMPLGNSKCRETENLIYHRIQQKHLEDVRIAKHRENRERLNNRRMLLDMCLKNPEASYSTCITDIKLMEQGQ